MEKREMRGGGENMDAAVNYVKLFFISPRFCLVLFLSHLKF